MTDMKAIAVIRLRMVRDRRNDFSINALTSYASWLARETEVRYLRDSHCFGGRRLMSSATFPADGAVSVPSASRTISHACLLRHAFLQVESLPFAGPLVCRAEDRNRRDHAVSRLDVRSSR